MTGRKLIRKDRHFERDVKKSSICGVRYSHMIEISLKKRIGTIIDKKVNSIEKGLLLSLSRSGSNPPIVPVRKTPDNWVGVNIEGYCNINEEEIPAPATIPPYRWILNPAMK